MKIEIRRKYEQILTGEEAFISIDDLIKVIENESITNPDDPRITENKLYKDILEADGLFITGSEKLMDFGMVSLILEIAAKGSHMRTIMFTDCDLRNGALLVILRESTKFPKLQHIYLILNKLYDYVPVKLLKLKVAILTEETQLLKEWEEVHAEQKERQQAIDQIKARQKEELLSAQREIENENNILLKMGGNS
jgi:hypothetical protein